MSISLVIRLLVGVQVPIWIGPAQEADSSHSCSLLWPAVPLAKCPPPPMGMRWANITLRNVTITSPKQSPGLVLGNVARPMENVVFENVVVTDPGDRPYAAATRTMMDKTSVRTLCDRWGNQWYKCEGVQGVANGTTSPTPPCFTTGLTRADPNRRIAAPAVL
eukprot:4162169-Prymnesium_polylepis.4